MTMNKTIFITHVRNLRNVYYANDINSIFPQNVYKTDIDMTIVYLGLSANFQLYHGLDIFFDVAVLYLNQL